MKKKGILYALTLGLLAALALSGCGAGNDLPAGSDGEVNTGGATEPLVEMVYVDGDLYYNTGRESDVDGRCGVMDGSIETTVSANDLPQENDQSNFGTGYEYQWVDDGLDVRIDGRWMRFEMTHVRGADFADTLEQFASKTGAQLLSGDGNACYSPLSLYYALSMAATGAAGDTQKQLYDLLGAEESDALAQNCADLLSALEMDSEESKLYLANSVWLNRSTGEVKSEYENRLKDTFGAELFRVDFTDKTNRKMTNWVKENTKGLLEPEFRYDSNTTEVLLNTLYFKDAWRDAFYSQDTREKTFTSSDGETFLADFMRASLPGDAYVTADYAAASLSFVSGAKMTFVLPDESVTLAELLGRYDLAELLAQRRDGNYAVEWSVPKFEAESDYDLISALRNLGIRDAFDAELADFSNASTPETYISSIKQGTKLTVDEEGVEAAAYTAIAKDESTVFMDEHRTLEMNLNRPFLYALRSADGTLLFVGVCERTGEKAELMVEEVQK